MSVQQEVYAGWLIKQNRNSTIFRSWRRRWVVIMKVINITSQSVGSLFYYVDDSKTDLKGQIDIMISATIDKPSSVSGAPTNFILKLSNSNKNGNDDFVACTDSQSDRDKFVGAISKVIGIVTIGNIGGVKVYTRKSLDSSDSPTAATSSSSNTDVDLALATSASIETYRMEQEQITQNITSDKTQESSSDLVEVKDGGDFIPAELGTVQDDLDD